MDGVGSGNGYGSRSIALFHRPGICSVPTLTRTVFGRILEVAVLYQLGIQSSIRSIVYVFEEDAYQMLADGFCTFRLHFDGCLHRLQAGKADGVLLGTFGIECLAVLLMLRKGDDTLHRGIRHTLHPALLHGTVQQNLLPHGGIDLCRPIFGKAGTVKVFLRFPLQQVGRLDVCEGVSAFRQFPDAVPAVVGTGLHQVRFQHPLHLPPGAEVRVDKRVAVCHAEPSVAIGTPG